MKTTDNNKNLHNVHVHFHIGRGGASHNAGHMTFVNEDTFDEVIRQASNLFLNSCTIDEEGNETPLPDQLWELQDGAGNTILQGRDAIENDCGVLEIDTIYDTDIVRLTSDLTDEETQVLWHSYRMQEYMSEDLKDDICTLLGYKRVHTIKSYHSNFVAFDQYGHADFVSDDYIGRTEEEVRDELEDMNYDPFSVAQIVDEMRRNEWFCEDEEQNIPETLRETREYKQMTLKDLSDATGINMSNLSLIERGRVSPTIDTLQTICKALGLRIEVK